jgi:hypothetical protein
MSLGIGIIASQRNKFLLDQYAGAAAAYSLRKLRSGYTGSAIRVRRSSDNTEQDIGFTSAGNLDESALTTFVGANDGFVVTWYDQSGNAVDLTQSSASNQPLIVISGTIITSNGKNAVEFTSRNKIIEISNTSIFRNVGYAYTFGVHKVTTTSSNSIIWLVTSGTSTSLARVNNTKTSANKFTFGARRRDTDSAIVITSTADASTTDVSLHTGAGDYINSIGRQYINGTLDGENLSWFTGGNTSDTDSQRFRIGQTSGAFNGYFFELVLYNTNKSSERVSIQDNINTYYSIY